MKNPPALALIGGRLLRVPAVAAELSVAISTVHKLCAKGDLAYVRVCSDKRIPRAALDAYLQARLVTRDAA
jgi:excisionase family DNA binding protein